MRNLVIAKRGREEMLAKLKYRNKGSFTATAIAILLAMATAVGVAGGNVQAANEPDEHGWPAITEPVNLAILIQDDLVGNVSNEIKLTKSFIKSLPQGSQVMIGYITTGTLQVRQPFTSDLEKAAGSLRVVISSTSASAFNPYIEVLEALKTFDTSKTGQSKNKNALLLISDGLDVSRGFDASTVLHSIDLDRAIKEANKRNVPIYSFYAPSVGLTRWNRLATSYGQSSLNRISDETGGKAFFQGSSFVTFDAHFRRLAKALNEQETSGRQSARSE